MQRYFCRQRIMVSRMRSQVNQADSSHPAMDRTGSQLPALLNLAHTVRKHCLLYAFSTSAEGRWYYRDNSLTGMCAIASFVLKRVYDSFHIPSKVIQGEYYLPHRHNRPFDSDDEDDGVLLAGEKLDHCYNVVYNPEFMNGKIIIDITASQFNPDETIVVADISDPNYINAEQLAKKAPFRASYRQFVHWMGSQKPTPEVINEIYYSVMEELSEFRSRAAIRSAFQEYTVGCAGL